MTPDDELERRLSAWGGAEVDGPDEAWADRLETRLRAEHAAGRRPAAPGPLRFPWLRPGWVAVATGLAVLTAGLLVSAGDPEADVLYFTSTRGAEVVLPNGENSPASDGAIVPEGAVVRVPADGEASVDGNELAPGRDYLVVDGELHEIPDPDRKRTRDRPTTSTTSSTTTTINDRPDPPVVGTRPDRTTTSSSTTTTVRERTTTTTATTIKPRGDRPTTTLPVDQQS